MASTDQLHASNLFSMKDAVCLITGGGTGIGLMAAQAIAANGGKVYITSRRQSVLENAAKTHTPSSPSSSSSSGGQIIPLGPCDVTSKSDLTKLVQDLESREKYLTLFIAAAGISGAKAGASSTSASEIQAQLWSEDPSAWSDTYNADVTSVFFSTVAVLPLLQAAPPAHNASAIVISSMSGLMRHSQAHFSYNAAKAATAHLSRMMSREFAKTGVRVNSIAPGYFPSEMTMAESDARNKADMPDEKVRDKGHGVPAGRAGRDEEMGMAVLFLARCAYVNGEVVKVDGGVLNEVGGG